MAEITEIAMMRTLANPVDAAGYLLHIVKTIFSSVTNFLLDHILRILFEPLCLLHKGHLNKTMSRSLVHVYTTHYNHKVQRLCGPASWSSGNAFFSGAGSLRFKSRAGQIKHSFAKSSPPLRHFFE